MKLKHSDILRAIRVVRCSIPVKLIFTHIYGHQDDDIPYSQLSRLAQLNVDCDKLTKTALKRYHKHQKIVHDILPHEVIVVRIRSKKITGYIGTPLRNEISLL